MLLQIVGNVPGLQNAGVMWAEELTAFLLGFEFTQSIVDRRLFYLHDEKGSCSWPALLWTTASSWCIPRRRSAAFNEAWRKRYRDPPDAEATARDFLGLKYVRAADEEGESVTISYGKALDDLEKKLGNLNPGGGPGARCTVPLPPAVLRGLERRPGPANALLPDSILPRARSILGLGGWVVCHARPDAMLGFVALSRRVSSGRLTQCA